MWLFDVNYLTQNNIYVQLLTTLCIIDLRQTSTERFVKPAVVIVVAGISHCINK